MIIGGFVGSYIGSYVTIKAIVDVAGGFIDMEMIKQAIGQYKGNIDTCYPSKLNISS